MRQHLDHVDIILERTNLGDWRAETRTIDDLGVNFSNYNMNNKDDCVMYLKLGITNELGITIDEWTVHEPNPEA